MAFRRIAAQDLKGQPNVCATTAKKPELDFFARLLQALRQAFGVAGIFGAWLGDLDSNQD
jgi:hypothetical protein